MNQTYYLLAAFLFLSLALSAQRIVPLESNERLQRVDKDRPVGFPKMDCAPDLFGINLVTAGDSINIRLEADTAGFPDNSLYTCFNCEGLEFGTFGSSETGITYFSNAEVGQGLDTLEVAFCNAAGDSCTFTEIVTVLVQRESREFSFPLQILSPQERVEVIVPADELPDGLSCRRFIDCGTGDNYPESGQESLFLFDQDVSNDFRYEAARLGGLDLVCLELCNDFGLCDSYTFPFRIVRENVDLPFFDDFSRDELRPDLTLWQNENVFINRSYGINPPSVGVATFDATDSRGRPYPGTDAVTPRDYLTSSSINMGTAGIAVLTFYAQPRGLGNRPEVQDSLVLEFLSPDGDWEHAWSQPGLSSGEGNCTDRPFIGYRVPVSSVYNYDGFQFRFYNLSNQIGGLDHWNLDYVRLDKNFTELNLDDVALIDEPQSVITPYLAMPYRQFAAGGEDLIRKDIEAGVWNHAAPDPFLPANNSRYSIEELTLNQQLLPAINFDGLDAVPAAEPFFTLEPLTALSGSLYGDYRDALLGLPNDNGTEKYRVRKNFSLNSNIGTFSEVTVDGIRPWVEANNEVNSVTVFDDYYAYDDGTAELALEARSGQTVVQEFRAYVPEVLKGISIRLPRVSGSTASQTIRLVVFLDSLMTDEPDFSMDVNPIYPENFYPDSLQGFTSYAFPEEIQLPVGRFYVGWQQLGNCSTCVSVGLDRNNIIEGTKFFNNGGNWFPFEGCSTGAIMVRPLVGDSPVLETDVEDFKVARQSFTAVFPNPAREFATLQRTDGGRMSDLTYQLFNLTGQELRQGNGNERIDLNGIPAGIYLVVVRDLATGTLGQHKLRVE